MIDQITQAMLEKQVDRLNNLTDQPLTPWRKCKDGTIKAQIGNYHLDGAYGGWGLSQMSNEGGGIHTIIDGHRPKRELFGLIRAYIDGVSAAQTS